MLTKKVPMIIPTVFVAIGCLSTLGYSGNSKDSAVTLNIVDAALVSIDVDSGKRVYEGVPFTGEATTYFADGKLAKAERFKNGRRHGKTKHWFNNGVLAYQASYQIGRRHGVSTSWWDNGNMRTQTRYDNDYAEGVAWSWYRNGNKYKRHNYVAGKPIGLQQGWRLNGKLFSNFEYRNGRTYGLRNSNLCVQLNDEEIAPSKLTN